MTAPITDRLLSRLTAIARDVAAGRASQLEAALLYSVLPELLEELQRHRDTLNRMFIGADTAAGPDENVVWVDWPQSARSEGGAG